MEMSENTAEEVTLKLRHNYLEGVSQVKSVRGGKLSR